jgi:HDOD domain
VRELLHRLDDRRHTLETLDRPSHGLRHFQLEVVEIRRFPRACAGFQTGNQRDELARRVSQEMNAVAHELERRVDFMCDARGEATDGLQLLHATKLDFHALGLGDLVQQLSIRLGQEQSFLADLAIDLNLEDDVSERTRKRLRGRHVLGSEWRRLQMHVLLPELERRSRMQGAAALATQRGLIGIPTPAYGLGDFWSKPEQPTRLADIAATAALLHNVGRLALITQLPDEHRANLEYARLNGTTCAEAERVRLGVTHVEIGTYLLGLWGLPHPVIEAVGTDLSALSGASSALTPGAVVSLAQFLAGQALHPGDTPAEGPPAEVIERLGITETMATLRAEIAATVHGSTVIKLAKKQVF